MYLSVTDIFCLILFCFVLIQYFGHNWIYLSKGKNPFLEWSSYLLLNFLEKLGSVYCYLDNDKIRWLAKIET